MLTVGLLASPDGPPTLLSRPNTYAVVYAARHQQLGINSEEEVLIERFHVVRPVLSEEILVAVSIPPNYTEGTDIFVIILIRVHLSVKRIFFVTGRCQRPYWNVEGKVVTRFVYVVLVAFMLSVGHSHAIVLTTSFIWRIVWLSFKRRTVRQYMMKPERKKKKSTHSVLQLLNTTPVERIAQRTLVTLCTLPLPLAVVF